MTFGALKANEVPKPTGIGKIGWSTLNLNSSFGAWDDPNFYVPQARVVDNHLYFRGLVKRLNGNSNTISTELPAGPLYNQELQTYWTMILPAQNSSSNELGQGLSIRGGSTVDINDHTATIPVGGWCSLDGLSVPVTVGLNSGAPYTGGNTLGAQPANQMLDAFYLRDRKGVTAYSSEMSSWFSTAFGGVDAAAQFEYFVGTDVNTAEATIHADHVPAYEIDIPCWARNAAHRAYIGTDGGFQVVSQSGFSNYFVYASLGIYRTAKDVSGATIATNTQASHLGAYSPSTHLPQSSGWLPELASITPLNGWTNGGGQPLQVSKTRKGLIYLSGKMGGGNATSGILCTLPVGFRPLKHTIFKCSVNSSTSRFGEVRVYSNGNVEFIGTRPSELYLHAIHFWDD